MSDKQNWYQLGSRLCGNILCMTPVDSERVIPVNKVFFLYTSFMHIRKIQILRNYQNVVTMILRIFGEEEAFCSPVALMAFCKHLKNCSFRVGFLSLHILQFFPIHCPFTNTGGLLISIAHQEGLENAFQDSPFNAVSSSFVLYPANINRVMA